MPESERPVTRFEVIDHTADGEGRILVRYGISAELVYQDGGQTLKVFLRDRRPAGLLDADA